jgi:hypothetical protein
MLPVRQRRPLALVLIAHALPVLAVLPACSTGAGRALPPDGASGDGGPGLTDGAPSNDRPVGFPDGPLPGDGTPSDLSAGDPVGDAPPGDATATDGGPPADGPLPYPTRTAYRIKGLQPDFWPSPDEIAGNNTGGIAMNLVWASWEPAVKAPPCASDGSEEEFDGHCFSVQGQIDAAIADWSARGLVVTAIVYGVPAWARTTRPCSPVSAGFEIFCAPDQGADYGRFAGMLARRYDGRHGHGRLADFVIHNEVNSNDWFDVGCGQGTACDPSTWISIYADSFNAAYDAVTTQQPFAKVLVSLEHHFGSSFDDPGAQSPLLSAQTFLAGLAPLVGTRAWRVAFHPYPPDLLAPAFSADDLPYVTYGNLGVLLGWLRATFPATPSSWEVQLTESGINSISPRSNEQAQSDGVCNALRNVVGTPGIESYIYHRMVDNPVEVSSGLGLGLRRADGTAKPAWSRWALANRIDLDPPQLDCGFEDLPYVRLTRSFLAARGHWTSTRLPPGGFAVEQSWHLLHDAQSGTHLLFECGAGGHNFVSPAADCEGQLPRGPLGYAYDDAQAGTVPLYRCRIGAGTDHFVSPDPGCEGQTTESLLGHVMP